MPLPTAISFPFVHLAQLVGELWSLQARLTALALSAHLDVADLADAAAQVAGDLAPIRARLAQLATALPSPPAGLADLALSPLELAGAGLECILTDRLDPAITILAAASDLGPRPSRELVQASLECVLADRLNPALAVLTDLLLPEDLSPHAARYPQDL